MEVQDKLLKPFCDVNFLGDHDKIIFVIEFLELCNQSDLIFTDIRNQCFKVVKSIDFFVECLEPFILEGKVINLKKYFPFICFFKKRLVSFQMILSQKLLTTTSSEAI